jgi:hypothetical protein
MRVIKSLLTSSGIVLVSAALFGSAATAPAGAQGLERPVLTAQECHPLTGDNYELCCVALNRMDILTAAEIDQCPPMTTAQIQSVLNNSRPGDRGANVPEDAITTGDITGGGIGQPQSSSGTDNGGGGDTSGGGDDNGGGGGDNTGSGGGGDNNGGGGGNDNGGGGDDNGGGSDNVGGGGGDDNDGGSDNGGGGGGQTSDHVNSGPGNGGEGAPGEAGDSDPGNSGDHNNAPDTPGGK